MKSSGGQALAFFDQENKKMYNKITIKILLWKEKLLLFWDFLVLVRRKS